MPGLHGRFREFVHPLQRPLRLHEVDQSNAVRAAVVGDGAGHEVILPGQSRVGSDTQLLLDLLQEGQQCICVVRGVVRGQQFDERLCYLEGVGGFRGDLLGELERLLGLPGCRQVAKPHPIGREQVVALAERHGLTVST